MTYDSGYSFTLALLVSNSSKLGLVSIWDSKTEGCQRQASVKSSTISAEFTVYWLRLLTDFFHVWKIWHHHKKGSEMLKKLKTNTWTIKYYQQQKITIRIVSHSWCLDQDQQHQCNLKQGKGVIVSGDGDGDGDGDVADCPAMSLVLVCWHSRKWQPPIRGGLSQMLVLWLEKLNQIDSFCKKGILYAWGGKRSIERGKKHGNPPKITAFPRPLSHFLSLSWDGLAQIRTNWFCPEMGQPKSGQTEFGLKWASPNQDKLILTWNGPAQIRTNWFWLEMLQPEGWKAWNKQVFWRFHLVCRPIFLVLDSVYVHDTDILKRNRTKIAFCGSTRHWNKSPPLHRGCHHQLNK